ncbi:hypothetical protein [Luteimonas sp. 100069]|uniref:hypothetical protein n=1 Tax=Luteimonas sp. 100069 TaxID=2006109 RepID=UPI000F4ED377|nr:hypothetical protein [Luteimonas sp. 100069]
MSKIDSSAFIAALRDLYEAIEKYGNTGIFSDHFGQNSPPVDSADMRLTVSYLIEKFDISWEGADTDLVQKQFDDLEPKIRTAISSHVPNLHSSAHVADALIAFFYVIDAQLSALLTPAVIDQLAKLPLATRKKIRDVNRRFNQTFESIGDVERKAAAINSAHDSLEALSDHLSDLEDAKRSSEKSRDAVLKYEIEVKALAEVAAKSKEQISSVLESALSAMERVNAAYRSTTSQGLAKEFHDKANKLNTSVYLWGSALVIALLSAVVIAFMRFPAVVDSLAKVEGGASWGVVTTQLFLSALSLGAPVWLAWVSTRQIGERFRLAEDYAYKAALSSAYEGYRHEAAQLDESFQLQLFSIALNRLDEIPLRLLDRQVVGSPAAELFGSVPFKEAMSAIPGFKDVVEGFLLKSFRRGQPRQEHSQARDSGDA